MISAFSRYRVLIFPFLITTATAIIVGIFHLDDLGIFFLSISFIVGMVVSGTIFFFSIKGAFSQYKPLTGGLMITSGALAVICLIVHVNLYSGCTFLYKDMDGRHGRLSRGDRYTEFALGTLKRNPHYGPGQILKDSGGLPSNESLWEPTSFMKNRRMLVGTYAGFILFLSIIACVVIEITLYRIIGRGKEPEFPAHKPRPSVTVVSMATSDKKMDKNTVFISYAWESDLLRKQVWELAKWITKNTDGQLEVIIDASHSTTPPKEGWLTWMHNHIEDAETVLVVCTPKYRQRFQKRQEDDSSGKGVSFEGAIISMEIYERQQKNNKFFPILPDEGSHENIPTTLKAWYNGHKFPSGNEGIRDLLFRKNPKLG